jgi:toxin FitB
MNGFLVDTNVISEILRTAPDANVAAWSQRQAKQMLFLSVVSMGELRKGITILPPSARRTHLEKSIETQVPIWFHGRILSVTQAIAERWGELDGIRQLAGRPLNTPDGMIAATALEHDLTVATRNTKDFDGLGVTLINPWLEQ